MPSFRLGNDIHFKVSYYAPGTYPDNPVPKAPDAIPTIDIQRDNTSLTGFPKSMIQLASNEFDYWWDSSGETKDNYEVTFLAKFDGHDAVGEKLVELYEGP